MTKRPNLFEANCPPQLKMHIGPKEVDGGVDSMRRLQVVYERTRALLFDGVNRKQSVQNSVAGCRGPTVDCPSTSGPNTEIGYQEKSLSSITSTGTQDHRLAPHDALKQLRLDSNFLRSSNVQSQCKKFVVDERLAQRSSCPWCRRNDRSDTVWTKCHFCVKPTCDACLQRCAHCCYDFCPLCSFKLYDRPDDAAVCLSCSSV